MRAVIAYEEDNPFISGAPDDDTLWDVLHTASCEFLKQFPTVNAYFEGICNPPFTELFARPLGSAGGQVRGQPPVVEVRELLEHQARQEPGLGELLGG